MSKEKNLELDRLVFFSDAVVAIAITLLALDLRLDEAVLTTTLSFEDIGRVWPKFSSFFLSFILIAVFWKVHHQFFALIKKIDNVLLWYNIFWLLFIVTLPFSTTLVSRYFNQTASVFIYSINTLMITLFQNQIWDYVAVRPDYLKEEATPDVIWDYRFNCNVAMFNAVFAAALSFVSPLFAFLILFTRLLMMNLSRRAFKRQPVKTTISKPLQVNKPYLTAIVLLTFFLPAVSVLVERMVTHGGTDHVTLIGKWFIFWAVGIRLLIAGIRQTINPAFTARDIFHIDDNASLAIVRELGFANLCFGLIGIISLFAPEWRIVSAFGSGLYYGMAGVNHIIKKPASPNERAAMISDIFIFSVLLVYVVFFLFRG